MSNNYKTKIILILNKINRHKIVTFISSWLFTETLFYFLAIKSCNVMKICFKCE